MGRAIPVRVRVSVINDTPVNGLPSMVVVNSMVSGPVIVAVVGLPVYVKVATETTVPVWTTPLLVRVRVEIGLWLVRIAVVNDMAAQDCCRKTSLLSGVNNPGCRVGDCWMG